MPALELSATKLTVTVWLLPLRDAVTLLLPAVVLLSVTVTLPSAPVVPEAAITAPLSALKLTT